MNGFWRGTVSAEAFGGDGERLLSLAAQAGIVLWEVRRQDLSLTFTCHADRYRELRPLVRKCGVRLRVKRRHGLPFLMRPFRLRWGLAVGGVLAAVLLCLLSDRVWVITVQGNEQVGEQAVLRVLEPLGVAVGTDFDAVDIPLVQLTALQRLPSLDWLTVNRHGSVVEVLVREKKAEAPAEDTAPANVVAACDGVIVQVKVVDGQAAVKAGDGVKAGSLLIGGVCDSAVGPILRHAKGTVLARVTERISVTVPLTETVTAQTRRERCPTAVLFWWRIPLYTADASGGVFTETVNRRLLTARGRELPIGWTVTERVYFEEKNITRTADQAYALAQERLAAKEAALSAMTVEDRVLSEQFTDEAVTVTATVVGVREIGVSETIAVSETS